MLFIAFYQIGTCAHTNQSFMSTYLLDIGHRTKNMFSENNLKIHIEHIYKTIAINTPENGSVWIEENKNI